VLGRGPLVSVAAIFGSPASILDGAQVLAGRHDSVVASEDEHSRR
jgi:hypothetical protein